MKIHSSCEIEDFVETHLCKLCVILRSRALRARKYIYDHSFFRGFGQEFFPVSASVCDSRNRNSRSNNFVRAPSSGDGPNAPRPAVSVPHLAGIGYVGWARQARSAQFFVFWAVYARVILGSWHMKSFQLNEKIIQENIYFQVGIKSNWLLISSPPHFFHGHTLKRLAYCRTTAVSLLFVVGFHG